MAASVCGGAASCGIRTPTAWTASTDHAACCNCHVVRGHHVAWLKSTHRAAAVCNDSHTLPNPIARYATKASNGFRHSFGFTTAAFIIARALS